MTSRPAAPATVHDLIAYAHVVNIARSALFYARLGFAVVSTYQRPDGETTWASLRSGDAWLMFERTAETPIDKTKQGVLFYLYTTDVAALRQQLLADDIVVSELTYPEHMPAGQIRLSDPDGYVLLIGQRPAA